MAYKLPEPAVSRGTLKIVAAILWLSVGLMLLTRAAIWLFETKQMTLLYLIPLALALGILKGYFVFARIANRNCQRIQQLSPHKAKLCVFAFQPIQSFLVILVMVSLGILLRLSPIRRDVLALIYIMIGTALLEGSFTYWKAS